MWIKTIEGESINTDYLSELYIKEERLENNEMEYWTAGWMPHGRKQSYLIQDPFPTKGKAQVELATLMDYINQGIVR